MKRPDIHPDDRLVIVGTFAQAKEFCVFEHYPIHRMIHVWGDRGFEKLHGLEDAVVVVLPSAYLMKYEDLDNIVVRLKMLKSTDRIKLYYTE